MMLRSAAKQRANRLEKMARAAIVQYNTDMAKGGEPLFSDWALELIGLISDHERMLQTLAERRLRVVDVVDFETNQKSTSVVQILRTAP